MVSGQGLNRETRQRLLSRRVILITGKGGVGRTTMTAAVARAIARTGRRVLITEIGQPDTDYSPLARIYGKEALSDEVSELEPGVQGCLLWAKQGHQLFVERMLPVKALAKAAMRSKALNRLLEAAPSFYEMGVFYQLLDLIKQTDRDGKPVHDTIIVDMPATGHALALTGLPDVLLQLMPTGPVADLLREGQAYLNDPKLSTSLVVTLPETLPVSEALELSEGLRATRMDVGAIMVNKVVPDPFTPQERQWLDQRLEGTSVFGKTRFLTMSEVKLAMARLNQHAGSPVWVVPEFSSLGPALIDEVSAWLSPSAQSAS